jgi:hypothetical protein
MNINFNLKMLMMINKMSIKMISLMNILLNRSRKCDSVVFVWDVKLKVNLLQFYSKSVLSDL